MVRPLAAVATLALFLGAAGIAFSSDDIGELRVGNGERLLVVAPHPDDETLGAGGLIQRVRARGGTVRILVVTAGDGWVDAVRRETGVKNPAPSQFVAYGERRLHEARAAALELGSNNLRLQVLGFPDGALTGMLGANWERSERSPTTGADDPPYDEAVDPKVPYAGAELRRALENILWDFRPTMVALPDPLDRHPDHRATGLFTLLALDEWAEKGAPVGDAMPRLLAYLVHWPAWPPGWDAIQSTNDNSRAPLPFPTDFRPHDTSKVALSLNDREIARKRAALAQHKTQREVMGPCLEAFVRRTEPFTLLSRSELDRAEYVVEESLRTTRSR